VSLRVGIVVGDLWPWVALGHVEVAEEHATGLDVIDVPRSA
jgi:hypothetical protein